MCASVVWEDKYVNPCLLIDAKVNITGSDLFGNHYCTEHFDSTGRNLSENIMFTVLDLVMHWFVFKFFRISTISLQVQGVLSPLRGTSLRVIAHTYIHTYIHTYVHTRTYLQHSNYCACHFSSPFQRYSPSFYHTADFIRAFDDFNLPRML